jgi:hypothetical protein
MKNFNLNNKKLTNQCQGSGTAIISTFKGSQYDNSDHNFSDYKNEDGHKTHRIGEFNNIEE